MEGEENRREQTPGGGLRLCFVLFALRSSSHGGGKVCHRCGWVYPNPHPSKKHRTAHRKHCSAAASRPSDGAADVAAAVEVKEAPPEQLSDEDPRNVSGEEVVEEEPKPEGGKGRGMGQSGVDVEELCKVAILEADTADYSPESDASCHGNKVPSSEVESTASQLDDTIHLDNDSVTCRGDKVCTMEGTESLSESPLTKGFCLGALKEEMDHAAVQDTVDSATVEDNIIIRNYVEDKLEMQIPDPQILPHCSCVNSSLTDSEFQRIDKSMEFSMFVDHANAITTLISGLSDEVSAMEFESVICTSPDEKTDVAGQISQVQPFCNDGPCNLEITAGELFETPTPLSACGYQIALPPNSPVNGNDLENHHSLPISSNMLLAESTTVKIESLEDSGLAEPDLTTCANAEAGSDIGGHVIDELSVIESDKNANSISSTLPVNVNEMERDESKDERNCQDMNSDRSQVVDEFEFEIGASANKFEGPKGESDWFKTPEQVPSVNKAIDLDDRVPDSCETCYLYEGKGTDLSHEGTSADNLRVADSAVSVSDGAIPSLSSATEEGSNFDAEVSPPTDSLATRDLHTSDPATEGTTHKSNLDHNDTLEEPSDPATDSLATKDVHTSDPATESTVHKSNLDHNDTLEEPSLIPLVEPEQKSDSIENKSVHDSKDEPEGRSIKEENAAGKVPNWNAGKPHAMLKNLLAEADLESKQEATGSQGHNASLSSKTSCGGSRDDGHSLRTAISDGPLDTQADHREWNSPARLPVTKHEKKKAKGRQSWVPFICCPSVN
ncbi:hypothetical protein GW17_00020327 [Ensete ventricosum]|nr:hypothetical protein GW17_00020327 [Ensete ventricosum]